jgi:hypothetical protein
MGGIMIPVGSTIEYTGKGMILTVKGMMLTPSRVGQLGVVISSEDVDSHYLGYTQILGVRWNADGKEQKVFVNNVAYLRTESVWEV